MLKQILSQNNTSHISHSRSKPRTQISVFILFDDISFVGTHMMELNLRLVHPSGQPFCLTITLNNDVPGLIKCKVLESNCPQQCDWPRLVDGGGGGWYLNISPMSGWSVNSSVLTLDLLTTSRDKTTTQKSLIHHISQCCHFFD